MFYGILSRESCMTYGALFTLCRHVLQPLQNRPSAISSGTVLGRLRHVTASFICYPCTRSCKATHPPRQTDRQTDRQTGQTGRQAGRDRQTRTVCTDRQTDRHGQYANYQCQVVTHTKTHQTTRTYITHSQRMNVKTINTDNTTSNFDTLYCLKHIHVHIENNT